ncbi:MAG: hypothetical protein ACTSU5_18850 [Promethearchaeota archaeon]
MEDKETYGIRLKAVEENIEIGDFDRAGEILGQLKVLAGQASGSGGDGGASGGPKPSDLDERMSLLELDIEKGTHLKKYKMYKRRAEQARKVGRRDEEVVALGHLREHANVLFKMGLVKPAEFRKVDRQFRELSRALSAGAGGCVNASDAVPVRTSWTGPEGVAEATPGDGGTRPEVELAGADSPAAGVSGTQDSVPPGSDSETEPGRGPGTVPGLAPSGTGGEAPEAAHPDFPEVTPVDVDLHASTSERPTFPPWAGNGTPPSYTEIPVRLLTGKPVSGVAAFQRVASSSLNHVKVVLILLVSDLVPGVVPGINASGELELHPESGVELDRNLESKGAGPGTSSRAARQVNFMKGLRRLATRRLEAGVPRQAMESRDPFELSGMEVTRHRGFQGRVVAFSEGGDLVRVVVVNAFLTDLGTKNSVDPGFYFVHDHDGTYFVPRALWVQFADFMARVQEAEASAPHRGALQLASTLPSTPPKYATAGGATLVAYGVAGLLATRSGAGALLDAMAVTFRVVAVLVLALPALFILAFRHASARARAACTGGYGFSRISPGMSTNRVLGRPGAWMQVLSHHETWADARDIASRQFQWSPAEMVHHPVMGAVKNLEEYLRGNGWEASEDVTRSLVTLWSVSGCVPPVVSSLAASYLLRLRVTSVARELFPGRGLETLEGGKFWKEAAELFDDIDPDWLESGTKEEFLKLTGTSVHVTRWTPRETRVFGQGCLSAFRLVERLQAGGVGVGNAGRGGAGSGGGIRGGTAGRGLAHELERARQASEFFKELLSPIDREICGNELLSDVLGGEPTTAGGRGAG